MGAYYTRPQRPRQPLWRLGALARWCVANRWAMAGLVLAQGMAALLYLVMVDNQAQVGHQRQAALQASRQRHACTLMTRRLEREQCLAALARAAAAPASQATVPP